MQIAMHEASGLAEHGIAGVGADGATQHGLLAECRQYHLDADIESDYGLQSAHFGQAQRKRYCLFCQSPRGCACVFENTSVQGVGMGQGGLDDATWHKERQCPVRAVLDHHGLIHIQRNDGGQRRVTAFEPWGFQRLDTAMGKNAKSVITKVIG
ncbi:MAG: hypothetical protein JWR17_3592 [Pseudomonas sp.]|nr:hypothetical protein [Pseudomonas sp.]